MKDYQRTEDDDNVSYAHYRKYRSKELVTVGFASQTGEPTEQEIYDMVDSVINQVFG